MRQRVLLREMDTTEILENMAYDMLANKEYRDKIVSKVQLEAQENQSAAEEAARIRQMFLSLGMQNKG